MKIEEYFGEYLDIDSWKWEVMLVYVFIYILFYVLLIKRNIFLNIFMIWKYDMKYFKYIMMKYNL